jgi:dipeptidyl aminopeptidase/acylaminoacyl peptidase
MVIRRRKMADTSSDTGENKPLYRPGSKVTIDGIEYTYKTTQWGKNSFGWFLDGKRHRHDDEPACIDYCGNKSWYRNGLYHRDGDKPAIVFANGDLYWYKNGKRHREDDKPAEIRANGAQCWYKNGQLHREDDKPAKIRADGTQYWYKNGQLHRDGDKPAVIRHTEEYGIIEEYWIDGVRQSNPETKLVDPKDRDEDDSEE